MKKIFTILPALAFMLASVNTFAQGVLKFESENHDFTKVTEGTIATHEFKFKNTGDKPLVISNVQASCGCTTPDWTKEPVMPGKTGFVKAAYNSNGRPGVFNKSITVTSNGTEPTKVLTIKGDVLTRAEAAKNYTPEQKAKSPKLTLTGNSHDFGKVESYRQVIAKFKVKNTGKTDLVISDVKTNCNCVSLQHIPDAIKPNKEATLELSYNPNLLGNRTEVVEIFSNDIVSEPAKVNLKAEVVKTLAPTSIVKEGTTSVPFK
ncbi:DUF1573 domain-containing protein [Adhaeribacter terreus]|uniref:DUF1573 domain-containing protein n=1 Tax=Adhaeribacter terreus TaxID=529703 RepID=A0ABW0EFI5_9BACT